MFEEIKETVYIVTSLPRTGTTTLCQMANICNIKSSHVLSIDFQQSLASGTRFYADTPFYCPQWLIGMLESNFQSRYNVKFIYSHRNLKEYKDSLAFLLSVWTFPNKDQIKNKTGLINHLCYENMSDDYINNHYTYIEKICKFYNIDMLNYQFADGWSKFCMFIDKPEPNQPIPHLNKRMKRTD